jgi:hypothetical protein
LARDTVDEHLAAGGDEGINETNRQIKITEHYVRMDYEGNNRPALYRVTTGGDQGEVLTRNGESEIVRVDMVPFAAMTPVIVTHRFFGRSIADLVMDIQRIKTALMRAILDNAYLAVNPRVEVSETHATETTLDDLLVSRPGGIVRTKMPGGVNWQTVPAIAGEIFPVLEYADATREWRTGVNRQSQGLDADALQNTSATAAMQTYNAAQARMKLIARIFAETGIRDLFTLLHGVIRRNGSQAATVRLRNQWVTIDPRDFKERNDLTVNVGLGTVGKSERLAHVMAVINLQKEALAGGLTNLVSVQNLYNSAAEVVKLVDLKNVDQFFTDPKTQAPPQPRPDPKLMQIQTQAQLDAQQAQGQLTIQDRKAQRDAALAQQRFELDKQMALLQHELAQRDQQFQHAHQAIAAATSGTGTDGQAGGAGAPNANLAPLVAHLTGMMQQMNAPKRVGLDSRPTAITTWPIPIVRENISWWSAMVDLVPVEHDPFDDPPIDLVRVDHDPFAVAPVAQPAVPAAAGAASAPSPSLWDQIMSVPGGIVQGFANAAAPLGQAESMTAAGATGDPERDLALAQAVPDAAQSARVIEENITGPLPNNGAYGRAVGEMLGNPMSYLGPGGAAAKVGMAAGAGLGSEAGSRIGGTPGRLIGGLLGAGAVPAVAGAAALAARGLKGAVTDALPAGLTDAEALASKNAGLYDFPDKPQRPFSADYPQEPATDATGRLRFDVEGRPLVAETIVGRRVLGGGDEALTPAEVNAVGTAATGRRPESVSTDDAGGAAPAGWLSGSYDSQGQKVLGIFVDRDLSPDQKAMVVAHETGHAIDHLAGVPSLDEEFWNSIPQSGLSGELERVFSAGSTGEDRTRNLVLPRHLGYPPSEVPAELMAEAARAYMVAPNYFKAVAPRTAAAIRAAANPHPVVSKFLQFDQLLRQRGGLHNGARR